MVYFHSSDERRHQIADTLSKLARGRAETRQQTPGQSDRHRRPDDHTFQLDIDGQTVATVLRTSGREIHRYKAYATQQPRRPR